MDAAESMNMDFARGKRLLTNWAIKAEKKIDSYYDYDKCICVLDVEEGCKVRLPEGAVIVLGMLLGDHGTDCDLVFDRYFSVRNNANLHSINGFAVIDYDGGNYNCLVDGYEVQDNCIVFNGKISESKITIQYLGYREDKDGFIMINENNVDAIESYLELRRAKRSKWVSDGPKFSRGEIQDLQLKWDNECRNARARSAEPTESERQYMSRLYNNPLSGTATLY